MIKAFLILIVFQILGETFVALTKVPIPGPVIGMILLFISLQVREKVSGNLQRVSQGLVNNLSLLFLPASVGIFFLPVQFDDQWPAILGALLGGTLFSTIVTTFIIHRLTAKTSDAR